VKKRELLWVIRSDDGLFWSKEKYTQTGNAWTGDGTKAHVFTDRQKASYTQLPWFSKVYWQVIGSQPVPGESNGISGY